MFVMHLEKTINVRIKNFYFFMLIVFLITLDKTLFLKQ